MPLGKKLNTILGDYFGEEEINLNKEEPTKHVNDVKHIKISLIDANPFQTRIIFDEEAIQNLADNIEVNGLMHPITVVEKTTSGKTRYTLIAGERRLRAMKKIGDKDILAVVKPQGSINEGQQAMLTAIENLQREDLGPLELGKTFEMLMKTQKLNATELGKVLAKSYQYVINYYNLTQMHPEVQQALLDKVVSEGHVRYLKIIDIVQQPEVLSVIVNKKLSTEKAIEYIKKIANREPVIAVSQKPLTEFKEPGLHPEIEGYVKRLSHYLPTGAKYQYFGTHQKGKIVFKWGGSK
jgi:ParB family transcriptional regulator, chromosome partitioning protein